MNKLFLIIGFCLAIQSEVSSQEDYSAKMKSCKKFDFLESMKCMQGALIPIFEGKSYTGEIINNKTIKNKVAVFNFWYIACPPCIAEVDGLNVAAEYYKDRDDVIFISFTREDSLELEKYFFPQNELKFNIVPNFEESIYNVFEFWWGYPLTIVIDKYGKIYTISAGANTDSKIASSNILEFLRKSIDECLEK